MLCGQSTIQTSLPFVMETLLLVLSRPCTSLPTDPEGSAWPPASQCQPVRVGCLSACCVFEATTPELAFTGAELAPPRCNLKAVCCACKCQSSGITTGSVTGSPHHGLAHDPLLSPLFPKHTIVIPHLLPSNPWSQHAPCPNPSRGLSCYFLIIILDSSCWTDHAGVD